MGKITYKLRKLGLKINGTTPTGETISETIDAIADDYTGGSGGTTVVANPTLAGTETNLTGLEVDGTKYAVPQGGGTTLYRHSITIQWTEENNNCILFFKLLLSTNTQLTLSNINNYIDNDPMINVSYSVNPPSHQPGGYNMTGILDNFGATIGINVSGSITGVKTIYDDETTPYEATNIAFNSTDNETTIIDNVVQF